MRRVITLALAVALCTLACGSDGDEVAVGNSGPSPVQVQATVLNPSAPVTVETSGVQTHKEGLHTHELRITWLGSDERRFEALPVNVHIEGDNGDLVASNDLCAPSWSESESKVGHTCFMIAFFAVLEPGEPYDFGVSIHPEVGPLRLGPGKYVFDAELIHWAPADTPSGLDPDSREQFTVRLTYTVN